MATAVLIGASTDFRDEALPTIDVERVREQLEGIRDSLAPLMAGGGTGGFGLTEVAVELGVTASGEVGFIVAKSEIELSASIALTFTRE